MYEHVPLKLWSIAGYSAGYYVHKKNSWIFFKRKIFQERF